MNKTKKLKLVALIIVLAIVSLVFGIINIARSGSTAEVALISSTKLAPGKTVSIVMSLESFYDNNDWGESTVVKEFLIDNINYDKEVFEDITLGNFVTAEGWNIETTESGKYLLSSDYGKFGTGTIVTLNLKVKEDLNIESTNVTFENIFAENYITYEEYKTRLFCKCRK